MAICALHNYGLIEDERFGDNPELEFQSIHIDENVNNHFVCYGSAKKDAERKRNFIAKNR